MRNFFVVLKFKFVIARWWNFFNSVKIRFVFVFYMYIMGFWLVCFVVVIFLFGCIVKYKMLLLWNVKKFCMCLISSYIISYVVVVYTIFLFALYVLFFCVLCFWYLYVKLSCKLLLGVLCVLNVVVCVVGGCKLFSYVFFVKNFSFASLIMLFFVVNVFCLYDFFIIVRILLLLKLCLLNCVKLFLLFVLCLCSSFELLLK